MTYRMPKALLLPISVAILTAGCLSSSISSDLAVEYYNIGYAQYEMGQHAAAVRMFREAIRLDPALMKARFNLALALIKQGSYSEADPVLEQLLEQDPRNTSVLEVLYYSYHIQGEDDRALAVIGDLLEIAPENSDARYNRALILWKLDRKEEAQAEFRRLLEESPDDLEAVYNLGTILVELGRSEEAASYLEEYLQTRPDDVQANLSLARAYAALKEYYRALDAYAIVIALEAKSQEAWFEKAQILLTKVEDPEKGLEALRQALDLGFRDTELSSQLLAFPDLIDRENVEELLGKRGLLPE